MLHYSTSGMLCRACDRLEPHNHTKKLYSVKCIAPLDEIEKYDLWCKTCLIDDEEINPPILTRRACARIYIDNVYGNTQAINSGTICLYIPVAICCLFRK